MSSRRRPTFKRKKRWICEFKCAWNVQSTFAARLARIHARRAEAPRRVEWSGCEWKGEKREIFLGLGGRLNGPARSHGCVFSCQRPLSGVSVEYRFPIDFQPSLLIHAVSISVGVALLLISRARATEAAIRENSKYNGNVFCVCKSSRIWQCRGITELTAGTWHIWQPRPHEN